MSTTKHTTNEASAQAQHTPGPWRKDLWKRQSDDKDMTVIIGGADAVAFVEPLWCLDERVAECEANARLIAAAPELLAALIWHRDALDLGDVGFYEKHGFGVSEIMPRTRQLIARATSRNC